MKKITANDSRQSVGLKWKMRKGLEDNIGFDGNKTAIGGDLKVDGNILSGFIGKATLPVKAGEETFTSLDCWIGEGIEDRPDYPMQFYFAVFVTLEGGTAGVLAPEPMACCMPICTRFASQSDYDVCHTMDEVLNGGFIPFELIAAIAFSPINVVSDIQESVSGLRKSVGDCSIAKYQHTVTIKGTRPSQGGGACFLTFTAYSSKNTPVDSAQDLIDVFGGCDLSVSGMYSPAQGTNFGAIKLMLAGAPTIADASLAYIDPSLIGQAGVKMSECGNLSFSDDVRIPK